MQASWPRVLVYSFLLAVLAAPRPAEAHVGAPYPVLLEEKAGPYVVSALADPDVGKGTFYVLATLADGRATPPDTVVTIWIEPEDGHQAWTGRTAVREETRYGERFVGEVPFDAEGAWRVRLAIAGSAGSGESGFPVEVSPSGIGWLATLAWLAPFVLVAGLWLRGTQRQRSRDAAGQAGEPGHGKD